MTDDSILIDAHDGLRDIYIGDKPIRDAEEVAEVPGGQDWRMYCLMRRDLNMPSGKLAAQAGHAFLDCGMRYIDYGRDRGENLIAFKDYQRHGQTKIVLGVDSLNELVRFRDIAVANRYTTATIMDEGRTIFNGVPTVTCFAFGLARKSQLPPEFAQLTLY